MNNLYIVFTRYENAPVELERVLSSQFENQKILAINKHAAKRSVDSLNDFDPDILLIYDQEDLNNGLYNVLTSFIERCKSLYVVYHQGREAKLISKTISQQNKLREICKNNSKLIYEAVEHHTSRNSAADALNKISSLIADDIVTNANLYIESLNELLYKPAYANPVIETQIHLWKSLSILAFQIKMDTSFSEYKFKTAKDNLITRKRDQLRLSINKLDNISLENFSEKLEELRKEFFHSTDDK